MLLILWLVDRDDVFGRHRFGTPRLPHASGSKRPEAPERCEREFAREESVRVRWAMPPLSSRSVDLPRARNLILRHYGGVRHAHRADHFSLPHHRKTWRWRYGCRVQG